MATSLNKGHVQQHCPHKYERLRKAERQGSRTKPEQNPARPQPIPKTAAHRPICDRYDELSGHRMPRRTPDGPIGRLDSPISVPPRRSSGFKPLISPFCRSVCSPMIAASTPAWLGLAWHTPSAAWSRFLVTWQSGVTNERSLLWRRGGRWNDQHCTVARRQTDPYWIAGVRRLDYGTARCNSATHQRQGSGLILFINRQKATKKETTVGIGRAACLVAEWPDILAIHPS